MKVLVTGGAGFIGSNLCKRLLNLGHEITVLDDLSTGFENNISDLDIHFVQGSVLDRALLADLVSGVETVVHLAALGSVPRSISDPFTTNEVNVRGTLNICEAAKATGAQVIFASSSSVYGSNPVLPRSEDQVTKPLSPYAVSKLAAESYVLAYNRAFNLPTVAFRFFNVYGPAQDPNSQYAAVVPRFIRAAIAGTEVEIHGDGEQSRDFTFVDDLTYLIGRAIGARSSFDSPVNLAFGSRVTINEIFELLKVQFPDLSRSSLPGRLGDVKESQSDGVLVRSLFGDFSPIPFSDGLSATIAWALNSEKFKV
jgi:UDP-glucose 4-epimerase